VTGKPSSLDSSTGPSDRSCQRLSERDADYCYRSLSRPGQRSRDSGHDWSISRVDPFRNPFGGPIAGAKVGRIDGEYVLNPTNEELELSDIDLFVAGSEEAIIMVEGSAKEVREEKSLRRFSSVINPLRPVIEIQRQLKTLCDVKKRHLNSERPDAAVLRKKWKH